MIEHGFMYDCYTMISQYVRVLQWGCVYLHEWRGLLISYVCRVSINDSEIWDISEIH